MAFSIISERTRKVQFADVKLRKSSILLKAYSNERINVLGQLHVRVTHGVQRAPLVLLVVEGDGPSLLGRNWLRHIRLDWKNIHTITKDKPTLPEDLMAKHVNSFKEGLGLVSPFQATLHIRADARPQFFKPRPVPFAVKATIDYKLDQLEASGIITKVTNSDWAAPIVPVPKKNGRFQICGDYKVTINQALEIDWYPPPKPEDLFATLAGGKKFTKLDLSQAYQQLTLDEESQKFVTIEDYTATTGCHSVWPWHPLCFRS